MESSNKNCLLSSLQPWLFQLFSAPPKTLLTIFITENDYLQFHNEVQEVLGCHDSSLDQVNATLQTILSELQSLRISLASHINASETNTFAPVQSSHQAAKRTSSKTLNFPNHNYHLKLNFSTFSGEDPTG